MSDNFISEEEWLDALGYRRRADLIKALDAQGIFYFTGRGGRIVVPKVRLPKQDDVSEPGKTKFQFE